MDKSEYRDNMFSANVSYFLYFNLTSFFQDFFYFVLFANACDVLKSTLFSVKSRMTNLLQFDEFFLLTIRCTKNIRRHFRKELYSLETEVSILIYSFLRENVWVLKSKITMLAQTSCCHFCRY